MSRLSREDAAKSTIAVWRWLSTRPDAPRIEGNIPDLLTVIGDVGDVSHATGTALSERMGLMEHLKLVTREERRVMEPRHGRTFPRLHTTTVIVERDVEKGARAIANHFARGGFLKVKAKGNQKLAAPAPRPVDPERVAIRTDAQDRPVEAVVGPDAPNPFAGLRALRKSEPAALVEAARQYNNRQDFVISRLVEMEKLGVVIDREKVMKGIKLERDDELEGIVKVLPFIDELEAQVKQAESWREQVISLRGEVKTAREEKGKAQTELARQIDANRRLSERMASTVARGPQVLVG
jgi:hypothetical protein